MNRNTKIFIGLGIFILISAIVFLGYLKNKGKKEIPNIIRVGEKPVHSPIPLLKTQEEETTTSTGTSQLSSPPKKIAEPLFKDPLFYLDLYYPLLYVYDPQNEVIKYFDLENESYKEVYKIYGFKKGIFSNISQKIFLETNSGLFILDLKTDTLYNIPLTTKNIVFTPTRTILYINNENKISYLSYFDNGNENKIRNLAILNPQIVSFKNFLFIYEKESPVFLLDLANPKNLKIFLNPKEFYSLLGNKNENLIYISFKEKDKAWLSEIIDFNKKSKATFLWGTVKEKCSFDDVLVCAVPSDLLNFNPEDWYFYQPNYDEKLIIYNPKTNETKEINLLEDKFDIVKPKLNPLGIIFWNRLDAKFYLIKTENLSL